MGLRDWITKRINAADPAAPPEAPQRPVIVRVSASDTYDDPSTDDRVYLVKVDVGGQPFHSVEIRRVVVRDGIVENHEVLATALNSINAILIRLPRGQSVEIAASVRGVNRVLSPLSAIWTVTPTQGDVLAGRQRHFQSLLDQIEYPSFRYVCALSGEALYLQISCEGKCDVTGADMPWKSGKWLLSEHMLDSEIVQKALKATLTALEHEARELFKYRGRAIFDPHYDVDRLWDLRGEQGAVVQREPPKSPVSTDELLVKKLYDFTGLPTPELIAMSTLAELYALEAKTAPRAADCDNPGAIARVANRNVEKRIRELGGTPRFDSFGHRIK